MRYGYVKENHVTFGAFNCPIRIIFKLNRHVQTIYKFSRKMFPLFPQTGDVT